MKRGCKFIEVSAFLDHRVDELLAGVVAQVRLRHLDPGRVSPLAEADAAAPTPHDRYPVGGRRRRWLRRLVLELWSRWTGRCFTACRSDVNSISSNCDNLFLP